MGLRLYLALLLSTVLLAAVGFIVFSLAYLRTQLNLLLSPQELVQIDSALSVLLTGQGIGLLACAVLLLLFLYLIIGRTIVRPVRSIVYAMDTLAKTGELVALPSLAGAPAELRALGQGFASFAANVDQAHKHDVEISRVKSDFISTAAHQLRTPLTGIRWALEALEQSEISEDQKALVKSATDKSHELVAIVGTLLDISSIESGKYKYSLASVSLADIAAEVARDFSPLATERKVSLFLAKGDAPIPNVKADRERIKWVLNNLVENAIRYTPAGGTVRMTLTASKERVVLQVRDTGIGIEPGDRANIFERFYRAQNAIAKENGGNGLGLYIARTIATDHGGDLNFAENTDGPGTTFSLSLPLAT